MDARSVDATGNAIAPPAPVLAVGLTAGLTPALVPALVTRPTDLRGRLRGAPQASLDMGRAYWPGLLLVLAIGLASIALEGVLKQATGSTASVIEALVLAILLGALVRNTVGLRGLPASVGPGVGLAGKQLLEVAVLLLGASVNLAQVFQAGPRLLLLIGLCVVLSLVASRTVGRLLGLSPNLALLIAVGCAVCGNSAIAAVAPVLRAEKKDVALAVALTAVVGVGLVLGLPALVPLLHLTQYQYGALVGTTVYAVPQVVAASFPVGLEAGEVATFVKLMRVLALGPIVLGCSLLVARHDRVGSHRRGLIVPWFVVGFLVLMAINSTGAFAAPAAALGLPPDGIGVAAKGASRWLMIGAMAALGLGVEAAAVTRVGPRVLVTVLLSVLLLVALSLGLIALLGL